MFTIFSSALTDLCLSVVLATEPVLQQAEDQHHSTVLPIICWPASLRLYWYCLFYLSSGTLLETDKLLWNEILLKTEWWKYSQTHTHTHTNFLYTVCILKNALKVNTYLTFARRESAPLTDRRSSEKWGGTSVFWTLFFSLSLMCEQPGPFFAWEFTENNSELSNATRTEESSVLHVCMLIG